MGLEKLFKSKEEKEKVKLATDELGSDVLDVVPFNISPLDIVLGGGLALGKIYEVFGWESCIEENTFIKFEARSSEGKLKNLKGGTVKRLYERFHKVNLSDKQQGKYVRKGSENYIYHVMSINENLSIISNPILDVVKTGLKPCYKITTEFGFNLISTKDHKFFTGKEYVPLSDLLVGDNVFVHNNTTRKGRKKQIRYKTVMVKNHPTWPSKMVGKHKYYRSRVCNAVVEASMNNMSYDQYILFLNMATPEEIKKIKVIPKGYDVHHKDENPFNDLLDNLEIKKESWHNRDHAIKNQEQLRFQVIPTKILSIEFVGGKETYDIKCAHPYNNYVANKIVVHNSGKSTFGLESAKAFSNYWKSKDNDKYAVLWIETESALDKLRAAWMGCDLSQFLISEAETVEEGFQIIESTLSNCVDKGFHLLAIWDTIAAAPTKNEKKDDEEDSQWSGGLGEKARMIRYYLKRLSTPLGQSKSTAIFINQLYKVIKSTPWGPKEESPGGGGLKFHSSVRIDMTHKENLTRVMPSGETITEGIITELFTVKNKLTLPKQKCPIVLWGERGFDRLETIFRFLKRNKITTQSASWTSLNFNEETIKFQNMDQLKEILVAKPDLENYLDFLVYQCFSTVSPLIKIKIIKKLWEYEMKFLGGKKTVLTDKEMEIANLLYKDLNEDEDEK